MKYKDLIEKLMPFADEEINMASKSEEFFYSLNSDDPVYGNKKYTVDEVRFYHPFEDNNDMIVGVDRLKSLRPQPHWKPGEEQMKQ